MSIVFSADIVPDVGHQNDWNEAISWHPGLTSQQRADRAPFQSAFGAGKADIAARALKLAKRNADLGSLLFSIVEEQAVWACLAEGMTIRATADHLAMNKSQVGRIAKRIKRRDGTPDSGALFPAGSRHSRNDVRNQIRDFWSPGPNTNQ